MENEISKAKSPNYWVTQNPFFIDYRATLVVPISIGIVIYNVIL